MTLQMFFCLIYILIIVVVVLFGIKIDLVLKWHLKIKNIGQIEIIGNGPQIQILEKKPPLLKENILPIQQMGHLNFVESEKNIFNNFDVLFVNGHTESQMIPHIKYKDKTIVFKRIYCLVQVIFLYLM